MQDSLRERLKADIVSGMSEAVEKHVSEFIEAYESVQDDNEDAKGLTLGVSVRLEPKADDIEIGISTRWSSVTKYKDEFRTPLDAREVGTREGDLPFKGHGDEPETDEDEQTDGLRVV